MADRNRAEGWQHAKLTGHENEELLEISGGNGYIKLKHRVEEETTIVVFYQKDGLYLKVTSATSPGSKYFMCSLFLFTHAIHSI
jgi:hypothetical protein